MPRPPSPPSELVASASEAIAALLTHTPYRVVSFLGAGGMGEVWTIEHGFLRKRFALKVLHPHLAAFADRMRLEAETMGRLNHPHVVEVVDFWVSADGRPCLVMELLEGRTLWDELVERKRLPVSEAVAITRDVLFALEAAHALGVVHRDLKPENVFLHEARGYGRVVKVLDFGLARVLPAAHASAPAPPAQRTNTGTLVGSPRFMSPEAWMGANLDERADVYAVGVLLFLMIAGRGPLDAGHAAPQLLSAIPGIEVSVELEAVVKRATAEQPADRHQTASEFRAALKPNLIASSLTTRRKR